jgi:hypothetical protein
MSVSLISTTDPDVLANRGVPVELVQTRSDGQASWEAHPQGVTSVYYVRFTNSRLMALEKRFGSLASWEQALEERPLEGLVASMSIGLGQGWPETRVAEAMAFGKLKDYRLAVAAAYGMALGRDPKAVKDAMGRVDGDMPAPTPSDSLSWETTGASSGPTSGPDGWAAGTTETSSGSSVSDSSAPSSSPWQ